MLIESKDNQKIKLVRSLDTKKGRDSQGLYIIESVKLIYEAVNQNINLKFVLIDDSCEDKKDVSELVKLLEKNHIEYCLVSSSIFLKISNTVTSQGILGVAYKNDYKIDDIVRDNNFLIFCDKLQDPGNLGTIIRTADAFGPCSVILSPCSVDSYNSKTVRAAAGAIYRVPIVEINDVDEFVEKLRANKYKIVSTVVNSNESFDIIDNVEKLCLVIGNEGNGVSEHVQSISDYRITIKMTGNTESLNASIAAAISIYEIRKKLL